MTKLQELIGLVEKASKSKHWIYYVDMQPGRSSGTEKIRIYRYPMEGDKPVLKMEELICMFTNIDNQIEMSAICAKMREIVKEDTEFMEEEI